MPPANDLPPPPYTETDIYSTSSGRSPIISPAAPAHHRRESSASTVDHDVIFTPPETPRSSPHDLADSHFLGGPGLSLPDTFVSAATYFDSRSAPAGLAALVGVGGLARVMHTLAIADATRPEDEALAYPAAALGDRDVRLDDWLTLVNYLFPRPAAGEEDDDEAGGGEKAAGGDHKLQHDGSAAA